MDTTTVKFVETKPQNNCYYAPNKLSCFSCFHTYGKTFTKIHIKEPGMVDDSVWICNTCTTNESIIKLCNRLGINTNNIKFINKP